MRKKRIILIVVIAVAVLLSVLVVVLPREREPEYGGKRLSEWVLGLRSNESAMGLSDRAIRQIGTNAVPYLVKWLGYEEAPWKQKLLRYLVRVGLSSRWNRRDQRELLAEAAASALTEHGLHVEQGIGELTILLNDPSHQVARRRAAFVLESAGGDAALPPLFAAMTNQPWLAANMSETGWHHWLECKDEKIRNAATNTLRVIAPEILERTNPRVDGIGE